MGEISPVMAGRIGLWGLIVGSRLIRDLKDAVLAEIEAKGIEWGTPQ